ncbi:hypothetical protein B5G43_02865 [Flavonifractor sp. An92]|uniref:putative ABC transporter permease n=1 Tax=Flavonifractor sp. An92 TaxID=1965666 RepID=UPI000B39327A|nr:MULTISPECIES: hypothetical protein [unclassified Flavonifractor]OUN08337.1 hypothetical protein B5G43_02865 [Flavonifractor sp. An92]OUQ22126.1 hypothetical protein B5E80_15110 [Flavonifractor sp. An135]
MTRYSKPVLSTLLWFFGGTLYFLLEVAYKTDTGHPQHISWTMLVLAVVLTIPVERCGAELPWGCPLWLQALCCAALVTVVELAAGLVLNVWLGLGVWDYTGLPLNLWGQICAPFSAVWFLLCLAFIPVFDWLRWAVEGGERPRYTWRW